jgi:hypothetical protein
MRSQQEIEELIEAAKEAESSLDGITTTSRASVWVGIKRVVAYAHHLLEQLWAESKRELEQAAASAIAGTAAWYASKVREWQYDYPLIEVNGRLVYLIDDADARLATKVAVNVLGKVLYIKVAKDSNGTLVPLTSEEKVSLDSYIRQIKFAGAQHIVVSTLPDDVRITGNVYYDGKLDLTAFQTAFESALNTYLKEIFFDGVLNKNRLRDAGEAVSGVIDFDLTTLEAKANTASSYTTVSREYAPASGYYDVDAFTLTYIAQ